jgi:hypothetical protein
MSAMAWQLSQDTSTGFPQVSLQPSDFSSQNYDVRPPHHNAALRSPAHGEGFAAQRGVALLFDRAEEGIEIKLNDDASCNHSV